MLTINGKPFIILDSYIDIIKIISLKDDFHFLYSSQMNKARTGTFHTGGIDTDNIPSIFREKDSLFVALRRANQERLQDEDLDKKLKHFENNQDNSGMVRYLKLRYRAYDPYNIMQIRSTDLNLSSSDALTLTDQEWDSFNWMEGTDHKIVEVLESLPFEKLGTITLFMNEHDIPLGYHRDFNFLPENKGNTRETFPHKQETIWIRFDLDRPFYLMDINGNKVEQTEVQGYAAFYNHHNWHGNFTGIPFSSLTMKIEGAFTEKFRKTIGVDNLEYYYDEQK
jgi:hypothetical protein